MKKRILFVIDSLNCGGAEKSLISLLTIFNYQKYDVDLLLFSDQGLYLTLLPHEVNKLNVPEYFLRQQNDIKHLIKNLRMKELFIRLGASLALRSPFGRKNMHSAQIIWRWVSKRLDKLNNRYDAAIAYSQGLPTYFVADKVEADKKYCWINTDYNKAAYNNHFDKKYYEKYDKVVAVSDYNKDIFLNEIAINQEKVCVIYDIVSPTLIKSLALQDGGFDDQFDGIRILTIGRLVDAKGYDMAIEACRKLKRKGYKFKWYVIGEGVLKSKLEATIKEYELEDTFILLGVYQNPYVFINQCDLYVQPSRFEGYGLAIAEAKILKKPIVATNFTVVHNQIKDGVNGLIVNMTAEDICNGIMKIIKDENFSLHISLNLNKETVGTEDEINKVYSLLEN